MDRCVARRIVRVLRSGVTNELSARAITVGTEEVEQKIESHLLDMIEGDMRQRMLMVEGDWGFGKSHLRLLITAEMVDLGIPHIHDSIDGRGTSLSHLHRCVPRWMEKTRFGDIYGLRDAIESGKLNYELAWSYCSVRQNYFATALRQALQGRASGWIGAMGYNFRMPDYSYQHQKALDLICSFADFLNAMELGGLIFLVDEVQGFDANFQEMTGHHLTISTNA